MFDRRSFFGRVAALFAGISIFGSKSLEAAPSETNKKDSQKTDPLSFAGMIQKDMPIDFYQEWSRQIETNHHDATTFANVFLEMMRDPNNDQQRKACSMFAAIMKTRSWPEISKVVMEVVDDKTKATFQKREAEGFYEQFRAVIIETIRDYWEQFLAMRKGEMEKGS